MFLEKVLPALTGKRCRATAPLNLIQIPGQKYTGLHTQFSTSCNRYLYDQAYHYNNLGRN